MNPTIPQTQLVPRTAFFGRIPERAFTLRAERALKSRDLELLGLVMTYAATGRAVVEARQRTFARRLCCSVRTVQRSLSRLAGQGLLAKQYRRDAGGRLLGLAYDVAPTLALMPRARAAAAIKTTANTTKTTDGESGPEWGAASEMPPAPMRQKSRLPNETSVAERDNSAPAAPATAEPSPVVAQMIALGVHGRVAATLADRCGEARCQQALAALERRTKIRDRAAWCVGCLLEEWDIAPVTTAPAARPRAHHPYHPPSPTPAAGTDPLDALPPGDLLRLEAAARAQLLAEMPVLRASFERGKSLVLIRARMKELLGSGNGAGGGQ